MKCSLSYQQKKGDRIQKERDEILNLLKDNKLDYDKISIKFNGVKLDPVDQIKYLGIYIDKYLSWDYHISELSKKLGRANGILSKLRYNALKKTYNVELEIKTSNSVNKNLLIKNLIVELCSEANISSTNLR